MRTLVQLKLRSNEIAATDRAVFDWLKNANWRPEDVAIPDLIRERLLEEDDISKHLPSVRNDTAHDHAVQILSAIPRFDLERAHALRTVKYVIHFDDTANNTTVWGLVCIDQTTVAVRWRHRSTRSLEFATEQLIEEALRHAGPGMLFGDFETGHRIPVREPLSTNDAYSGIVLGTRESRVMRAKAERKLERVVGLRCAPNPFNASTSLEWELGDHGAREIRIFDISGRTVRVLPLTGAQSGAISFDGRDGRGMALPSGTYLASVVDVSGTSRATQKVILAK